MGMFCTFLLFETLVCYWLLIFAVKVVFASVKKRGKNQRDSCMCFWSGMWTGLMKLQVGSTGELPVSNSVFSLLMPLTNILAIQITGWLFRS